ncbi:hypothetical protein NA57DRAFT_74068 [Rhizodiscina lignyota]|uniref:BRCT domain-containing protein n=1 Tax=Rhizodiscina lignyota TaxID=1504668 RepID=A0A9P4IJI6_9PEZI|nr:hypothetical protein NA57DRAFT_74068 [Rhizodiscina lignyota]
MVRLENGLELYLLPSSGGGDTDYWKDWKNQKQHKGASKSDKLTFASCRTESVPENRFRLVIRVGEEFKYNNAEGLCIDVSVGMHNQRALSWYEPKPTSLPVRYVVECASHKLKPESASRTLTIKYAPAKIAYAEATGHETPRLFESKISVSLRPANARRAVNGKPKDEGVEYTLELRLCSTAIFQKLGPSGIISNSARKHPNAQSDTKENAKKSVRRTAKPTGLQVKQSTETLPAKRAEDTLTRATFQPMLSAPPVDCLRGERYTISGTFIPGIYETIVALVKHYGGIFVPQSELPSDHVIVETKASTTRVGKAQKGGATAVTPMILCRNIQRLLKNKTAEGKKDGQGAVVNNESCDDDSADQAAQSNRKRRPLSSSPEPSPSSKRRKGSDNEKSSAPVNQTSGNAAAGSTNAAPPSSLSNGKETGTSSDMPPSTSAIDSLKIKLESIGRLCTDVPVLHTTATQTPEGSKNRPINLDLGNGVEDKEPENPVKSVTEASSAFNVGPNIFKREKVTQHQTKDTSGGSATSREDELDEEDLELQLEEVRLRMKLRKLRKAKGHIN